MNKVKKKKPWRFYFQQLPSRQPMLPGSKFATVSPSSGGMISTWLAHSSPSSSCPSQVPQWSHHPYQGVTSKTSSTGLAPKTNPCLCSLRARRPTQLQSSFSPSFHVAAFLAELPWPINQRLSLASKYPFAVQLEHRGLLWFRSNVNPFNVFLFILFLTLLKAL